MPPPGLLRLGGALREAGIDVELDDLAHRLAAGEIPAGEDLADGAALWLARRGAPDILGLSVMGATLPIALAILERLRPLMPNTLFVLGGPGVHGTDERVLERFPQVDVIVRGEGEVTAVELSGAVQSKAPLESVPGLTLRRGSDVVQTLDRPVIPDLALLPQYAWDLLPPIARYKEITGETDGLVPIDSGRGCVYDCSFCSIGRSWSRRSRAVPVPRLLEEVKSLKDMPGARRAYMCHDIFGANRTHALEFCQAMVRDGVDLPWEARARADHLDAELLEWMGRAGCDRVLLGIESASPKVRRAHQKGMADDIDLLSAVDRCVRAGVTPILSLILGLPDEGDIELNETLAFCADAALRGGVNLSLHIVNPQPGCELGERLGAQSLPLDGVPPDMALGAGDTGPERSLIEAHPDLFSTWAILPENRESIGELLFLKEELAETLMRFPRSFAALSLALDASVGHACHGLDTLGIARALRADGRTFETFARTCAPPEHAALIEALLAWEIALVRVAASGPRRPRPGIWRTGAILIESPYDLGAIGALLSDARERRASKDPLAAGPAAKGPAARDLRPTATWTPPPAADRPMTFAVVAAPTAPGRLAQVRTLKLGDGAARLVGAVAGAKGPNAQARVTGALRQPKLENAARNLVASGILTPPADPVPAHHTTL